MVVDCFLINVVAAPVKVGACMLRVQAMNDLSPDISLSTLIRSSNASPHWFESMQLPLFSRHRHHGDQT